MTRRPDDAAPSASTRRALVVVAAGSGTRLGRGIPKAAVQLGDQTILEHALEAVTPSLDLDLVVLVLPAGTTHHDALAASAAALAQRISAEVVTVSGGSARADSVTAGVGRIREHARLHSWGADPAHVLVHDAARALTPTVVFERIFSALENAAEAAVPGLPVSDTIKRVTKECAGPPVRPTAVDLSYGHSAVNPQLEYDGSDEGAKHDDDYEQVRQTLPRSELRAIQTPQGFTLDLLERLAMHLRSLPSEQAETLTDEAMIAEQIGIDVVVVPGHPRALKITTETDLLTARTLLTESPPRPSPALPRVGIGQDIHAFATQNEPAELWLAGLHWPGERGLTGHSDGDAVAHACCDALFSAAGLGDLGVHFGTDRPELAGAHGTALLEAAARIVREAGFAIGSISVQFIGNRPRFGPRRHEAQRALTGAVGAPVAVAATTSDGLGFAGRGEGIMATATAVLVESPSPGA